jgi:hypothetical protein
MRYVIALFVVLALTLAACQSSSPTPVGRDQPQEQQANPTGGVPSGTGGQQPSGKIAPEDDARDDFKALIGKKSSLSYMVEYDMTSSGTGGSTSGVMTQYVKGTKFRTDTVAQGVESRTLLLADGMFSCSNQGEWTCMKITVPETKDPAKEAEDNAESSQVTALPSRTIAGVSTKCFRVIVSDGQVDYCLSPEGVPLYMKSSGEKDGVSYSSELTAKRYSTSVSDSAFELPAEAQDLSELMKQYAN